MLGEMYTRMRRVLRKAVGPARMDSKNQAASQAPSWECWEAMEGCELEGQVRAKQSESLEGGRLGGG